MPSHIKSTIDENKAWCGSTLSVEFYFKDAEQAAINGVINGKNVSCPDCVQNIIHYLTKPIDEMVNS